MVTASRQMAEWCAGLKWDEIPEAVRVQVPLRVLDTVGLIIVGANTAAGQAALDFAHKNGGIAQSTIVGSESKAPPAEAALVHGIAAHCRDFDDTFMDSVVHPGSVIIPTALAMAEATFATAEDFATAIVVGYEVAARIGAVAGRRFHARSLHATGVVGPIAAAATAGRLLRLGGELTSWAMGLSTSMSSGLMAFIADGGWSKWLHLGWAAHGGIVAAELAARGFRGPEHVLDGGHDLYTAFLHGKAVDRSGLTADLGLVWRGSEAEFKYYPCAHVIQPYIDAVLGIMEEHDLNRTDIALIECTIAPWASAIVCEPREAKLRFDTELEAIGSLPYQLAVAVIERTVDLHALSETMRQRADIKAMAERIVHTNDPSLGKKFDGAVDLCTLAGGRYKRQVTAAGADVGKLCNKFIRLVGPIVGEERARGTASLLLDKADWRLAGSVLRTFK